MDKNNQKLFEKAIVQKRNVLNEIRKNNMSLSELRLFSVYLSKINSRDVSTRLVRFPLEDFQKIIGVAVGTDNITHFRNTIISLLQQVVQVPNERGGYTAFQLFKQIDVDKDEFDQWYVEIDAHDKALPLMFDFKNRYFSYELWNALRLKSSNQIRMYEILKQYETLGKREIAVTELREMLGISSDEYPRWDNFKIKVLDSCQHALAENTDITFTYEKGKSGRGGKWLTIIFHIQKNKKHVDKLNLEDFIDQNSNIEAETIEYGGELADLLGETCNNEFSPEQIRVLQDLILRFIGHDYIKCSDYLTHKLNITNAYCKRKDTESRYKYLLRMINNDIKNPNRAL